MTSQCHIPPPVSEMHPARSDESNDNDTASTHFRSQCLYWVMYDLYELTTMNSLFYMIRMNGVIYQ